MKKLIIVGASGHGRVVADIARLNGYDIDKPRNLAKSVTVE